MAKVLTLHGNATFSKDGLYRYSLTRDWGEGPRLAWLMLNPSTADAEHDDPTIERCIGFARAWGFGGIEVVNLFALRSSDPRALTRAVDPVGPGNDRAIRRALDRAGGVVAAWGNVPKPLRPRAEVVRQGLAAPACLGLTALGEPVHPLYCPAETLRRPLPQ